MSWVYFIICPEANSVKIGFTRTDPRLRMASLQTGCPLRLDLAMAVPGTREDEEKLHRCFAPLRMRGEWFWNDWKLKDFHSYLGSDHIFYTREEFEDIIVDVIASASLCHPDVDPERYLASASSEPYADLVAEYFEGWEE